MYLEVGLNIHVFFMTPSKKLWSEIKYWIILLVFFLILFEMISSMILFRKYTFGKLALLHFTERFFSNKSPHEVTFAYEPYMMFRAADITSDAVNVSGFRRKSVPDVHAATTSSDTIDIYFFGGGTMYGSA